MLSFEEVLQQLDLQPSPEERRSLEVGIHLSSVHGTPQDPELARRDVGWHLDRLMAALGHAAAEVFFDEFGRYCGRIVLASLDEEAEQDFLAGGIPDAEMLARPLGTEAWIVDAAFWYGALGHGRRVLRQVLCARGIETVGYIVYRTSRPPVAKVWTVEAPAPTPTIDVAPLATLRTGQLRHDARSWLAERQAIGAAMRVLASSASFRELSLNDAMCLLLGPIHLDQYALETTAEGAPISFRSWAYFTDDAAARLASQGPSALSDGCWNQGLQKTVVCDWRGARP